MGTSTIFSFCVAFLFLESILFMAVLPVSWETLTSTLAFNPPPSPSFGTPWYEGGVLSDVGKAIFYIGQFFYSFFSIIGTLMMLIVSIALMIFSIAITNPFILIPNLLVYIYLFYSIITRVTGGD